MPPRPWETRIKDILCCAYNIRAFTEGMSLDSFLVDPKSVRAVTFEFVSHEGEAIRAMPKEIQEQIPQIPCEKMKGIQNILVIISHMKIIIIFMWLIFLKGQLHVH